MPTISEDQPFPPLSSEETQKYKDDYRAGLKLFCASFSEYNKPGVECHKKAKLKSVMDKALDVMNKTACVALKEGKARTQEAKLVDDYKIFIQDPTSIHHQQIIADIQSLE